MTETIKTLEPAVSLALSSEELRTLLADNTVLVQGLFRTLAGRRSARTGFTRGIAAGEDALLSGELSPIEKVLALRQIPVFARVSVTEMLYVASIARQIPLAQSMVLADDTNPFGLGIVLSGRLALTSPDQAEPVATADAGDALGVYETLAGLEATTRVEKLQLVVREAGSALEIERDELFDLLGQRPNLLQQIFAAVFDRPSTESTPHLESPRLDRREKQVPEGLG